jgi:hypothetical protein
MPLTDAGRNHIATTLVGEAVTAFNNANANLGVGDSTAVFAKTQTDLQAAVNKLRKTMEATYPQRATNVLTFRSLFGTTEANFAWQEWGVFNAAAAGTMLCRKVESLGTKASTQSWHLTGDLTINNP